jgi:hypothetical protein
VNNNNNEYFYTSNNLLLARLRVEWRNQVRTSIQKREGKVHTQIQEERKIERHFWKENSLQ